VYEPPASGTCDDKLTEAKALLNLRGSDTWRARARKQLLSLLFNVASGRVSQTAVVSDDGATLSQAITYCDSLIDDPAGDHHRAREIARRINNDRAVPSGWIPLDTENIAYRELPEIVNETGPFRSWPNPGAGARNFFFRLESAGEVTLEIFDVAGRLVATPFDHTLSAGPHRLGWDGRGSAGERIESGIFFARLSRPGRRSPETIKLVLMDRASSE
jgi:hypothetical protein